MLLANKYKEKSVIHAYQIASTANNTLTYQEQETAGTDLDDKLPAAGAISPIQKH